MQHEIWITTAIASGLVVASPAAAQQAQGTAAEAADSVDEGVIIVTARKRNETLQDVPIAISAFTAKTIEDAGIKSVTDIATMTPGFTFAPLFGGNGSTPVIRGQSTTIGEPNVGFFVDGVYQSSRAVMDAMLGDDIERIEVVKGPQSALYGRNTFGGAVNYITRRPTNALAGHVKVAAGDYEQREARASLSGAIAPDTLYFSLGGTYIHDGGFFHNSLTNADLDNETTKVVTGGLEFSQSSSFSIRLRAGYEDTNRRDYPLAFIPNTGAVALVAVAPAPQIAVGTVSAPTSFAVTPGYNNRNFLTSSLTIDADIGSHHLTAISGYNDLDFKTGTDLDYEARQLRYQTQDIQQKEYSQEIRLLSPATGTITYLFGGYYYGLRSDTLIDDRIGPDALPLATAAPASLKRFLQGGVTNQLHEETDSYSVFGQLAGHFGGGVTLTAEGRYSWETKRVSAIDTSQFGGTPGTFVDKATFKSFVPRFILDYKASENLLLYASVAKAEKAGGFNVVTATGAILPSERTYKPENAWTYELGVKGSTSDHTLSGTADVYLIKWSDQIVRALGQTLAVLNINAGKTTSKGFELELHARPAKGLLIDGTFAYTDAHYDRYTFGSLAQLGMNPVLDGRVLQYVSKYAVSMAAQYEAPITDGLSWFGRADISLLSKQSAVQPANSFIGDAAVLNVRTGFDMGDLQVRFYVENLTKEDASPASTYIPSASTRYDFVRGALGAGPLVGFQAFGALTTARRPRSFGVSLGYHF